MICIILAAGYATRLYPLTENFPKPLLKVGEKTIMDWLTDDISNMVSHFVVVSNHRYVEHFKKWAQEKAFAITVIDDGSASNETRLGAVKDIWYAIESEKINDDVLVIAGDNVLDFSLKCFIGYAKEKDMPCVMRYYEHSIEKLRKTGVAQVDETDQIIRMEEKPEQPFAHWCTPPFYFYPREALHYVKDAIDGGCNTDAPGSFIAWLSEQTAVYAMEMPGSRYDIGNLESFREVQTKYKGIL